jgi:hypothetical protein
LQVSRQHPLTPQRSATASQIPHSLLHTLTQLDQRSATKDQKDQKDQMTCITLPTAHGLPDLRPTVSPSHALLPAPCHALPCPATPSPSPASLPPSTHSPFTIRHSPFAIHSDTTRHAVLASSPPNSPQPPNTPWWSLCLVPWCPDADDASNDMHEFTLRLHQPRHRLDPIEVHVSSTFHTLTQLARAGDLPTRTLALPLALAPDRLHLQQNTICQEAVDASASSPARPPSSSVRSRPFSPTLPNTMTSRVAPPTDPAHHRPPNGQWRRHPYSQSDSNPSRWVDLPMQCFAASQLPRPLPDGVAASPLGHVWLR